MNKVLDKNGLLLCEYQAKIFEESTKLNCSSKIFLRRFINSSFTKDKLDKNDSDFLTLQVIDCFNSLKDEYGPFHYGKTKYNPSSLYWLGYITRAISYFYNINTRLVNELLPFNEIINRYYVYHTLSIELAIEELISSYNLSEKDFDINERFKNIYRLKIEKLKKEGKIDIPLSKELIEKLSL